MDETQQNLISRLCSMVRVQSRARKRSQNQIEKAMNLSEEAHAYLSRNEDNLDHNVFLMIDELQTTVRGQAEEHKNGMRALSNAEAEISVAQEGEDFLENN